MKGTAELWVVLRGNVTVRCVLSEEAQSSGRAGPGGGQAGGGTASHRVRVRMSPLPGFRDPDELEDV